MGKDMNEIQFNEIPKELERPLQDAAFELARTYEAYQRAAPEAKKEAQEAFHAAAHMVEKIVKQGVSAVDAILNPGNLETMVRGQLKTAIKAHGPITYTFVGSAARRVAQDLLGYFRQTSMRDISNASAQLEVTRLRKDLNDAGDRIHDLLDQIRNLKAKLPAEEKRA